MRDHELRLYLRKEILGALTNFCSHYTIYEKYMVGQLLITFSLYYFGFLPKEEVKSAIESYIKPHIQQQDKLNELLEKTGVAIEEVEKKQIDQKPETKKEEVEKMVEKALKKGIDEWYKLTAEKKQTLYIMALKHQSNQYARKIIQLYEYEKDEIIAGSGDVDETITEKQERKKKEKKGHPES